MEIYNLPAARVLEQVKSSFNGLTSKDGEERLRLYGKNVLERKKRPLGNKETKLNRNLNIRADCFRD